MGRKETHDILQEKEQSHAPGEEQPHVAVHAGSPLDGKKLCRESPWHPGWYQVNHKMYPFIKSGHYYSGLHSE